MRGRQKGQTKRMSIIKDPVIAPYEIQVEEDQYVLIDTEKDKPMGYYSNLSNAIQKISRLGLANQKEDYTLTGFIESYKNIVEQLTKFALSFNNNETKPATSSGLVTLFIGFLSLVFSTHSSQFSEIFVNALVGVIPA